MVGHITDLEWKTGHDGAQIRIVLAVARKRDGDLAQPDRHPGVDAVARQPATVTGASSVSILGA